VIALGGCIAMATLTAWYYMVFIVVADFLYVILRAPRLRVVLRSPRLWLGGTLATGLVALLVVPFAIPLIQSQQQGGISRGVSDMNGLSIAPVDIFTLSSRHPLWGPWAAQTFESVKNQNVVEKVVMPGYLLSLLALGGVVFSRKRRVTRALVALTAVFIVCALGPLLVNPDGSLARIPLPAETMTRLDTIGLIDAFRRWFDADLAQQMRAGSFVYVPLPYALVYQLPVINSLRSVSRYAHVMNYAVAGLAALGLDELARRALWRTPKANRRRMALNVACVCLSAAMVFEYWQVPWATTLLAPRPIDLWLSTQPRGTVVELPPARAAQRINMFARIIHGQPTVLGAGGSFPPAEHNKRIELMNRLPDRDAVQALCSWDARYVLINTARMQPDDLTHWRNVAGAIPELRYDHEISGFLIYLADGCRGSA
jgi:hypothetical protein